jgi:hypothetical protein
MNRLRFKPVMEELAPRVLPDANPLSATIVGPFAPGMYPTDPPPAGTGGHPHRWLLRFEARADGWTSQAQADLGSQPGQSGNLRADLTALSQSLFALAGQERARADNAGSRAALAQALGHLGQAARWGMEENQHARRADQYSAGWQSIDQVLGLDDVQLYVAAPELLNQWLVTAVGTAAANQGAQAAAHAPGQTWHQLQQNLFTYGGTAASAQGAAAVYAGLEAIVGGY